MRKYRKCRRYRSAKDKKRIYAIYLIFSIALIASIGYAYFTTTGSFSSSSSINILPFGPKVNGSYDISQTINLSDTITNGKNLAPGAEGKFKVDIDFTQVGTNVYYKVYNASTNIPNNLKFYVEQ